MWEAEDGVDVAEGPAVGRHCHCVRYWLGYSGGFRGEQISAIWFVVVALCSYAIAYRFYAYYIQIKIMRTARCERDAGRARA